MIKTIEKLLYMPPEYRYYSSYYFGRTEYSEIDGFSDHKIPIIHIKSPVPAQYTIVYSHANAEDLWCLHGFLKEMSKNTECDIVCYDYPGYGKNKETITEENMKNSGIRVVQYLVHSLRIDPSKLILYGFGHSLGSAISAYAAVYLAENSGIRVGGVVLQSCFLSIMQIGFLFRKIPKSDLYITSDIIGRIQCPVCLIHGKEDVIVPIAHAKRLFLQIPEKYRYRCLFIESAGHNNLESYCKPVDLYYQFLIEFKAYLSKFREYEMSAE